MTGNSPRPFEAFQQWLAPFDEVEPSMVVPLVEHAIAEHRAAMEDICASPQRNFESVLLAREAADLRLSHVWSPIAHLNRVANTPELREAHAQAEALLTDHGLWVGQNRALYDATVAARWSKDESEWSMAQRRLRTLALRDFELAGVALADPARERFRAIAAELSKLGTEFSNAVLDATDAFHLDVKRKATLAGIPAADLARFRAAAAQAGVAGWRIGLQAPDVQAVLTHAQSRWLRRRIYEAQVTRASELGPQAGLFDNSARIERIMALRHEAALLLGFDTVADRSLATKMASSPDAVEKFLLDLAASARPAAQRDLAQLEEMAASKGIARMQPWDTAWLSELIRRDRYAIDAEEVRAYFPASRVTDGIMALITRLFGVHFVERSDVPLWHPDARYVDVTDSRGKVIAGVYLDLFARQGKISGAWMDICRQRLQVADTLHLPIAYLVCNFGGGAAGQEATLRHDDVVTFFHEFGHVLHHILTEVDYPSIGGISGVEWDAVELPSQLMENFAWDYPALSLLSAHAETGEPLPRPLFDKMLAARHFQAGMRLVRQVEFALFDLRLHRDYRPELGARTAATLARVRREVAVIRPPAWNRFANSFTHIFAGGYSAGYYSYLWAELLSADAFGRFREAGGICSDTGQALRAEVLARGATRTAAENFAAFRGREPEPDALLESYGLAA